MTPEFPPVSDNQEKNMAYKDQMERFKQARASGFYFEGIFILYAVMEDRLSSFLFHAGISNNKRDKLTTNKNVRPWLDSILNDGGKNTSGLNKMSRKVSITQQLLIWASSYPRDEPSPAYADALAMQIRRTARVEDIPATLNALLTWCESRNVLVHALLNTNPVNQKEALLELIKDGEVINRQLKNFVKSFQVRNTIRRQFNIQ